MGRIGGVRTLFGLAVVLGWAIAAVGAQPGAASWDTFSDTWVATDSPGRSLPSAREVGLPRKDRTVGMFYFLWHGAHIQGGPYDVTQILAKDPNAMQRHAKAGFHWTRVRTVPWKAAGRDLELSIPWRALGLAGPPAAIDFKWSDNPQLTGDWSDFTLSGDAAPNDRFNYRVC
jgi:hypothetical protein